MHLKQFKAPEVKVIYHQVIIFAIDKNQTPRYALAEASLLQIMPEFLLFSTCLVKSLHCKSQ